LLHLIQLSILDAACLQVNGSYPQIVSQYIESAASSKMEADDLGISPSWAAGLAQLLSIPDRHNYSIIDIYHAGLAPILERETVNGRGESHSQPAVHKDMSRPQGNGQTASITTPDAQVEVA
jgi:hypothetical protein